MSTTATDPVTEQTREQKIELYIVLDALDTVIGHLGYGPLEFINAGGVTGIEDGGVDFYELELELIRGNGPETSTLMLQREIWPEDPAGDDVPREERPEYVLAGVRSDLLVSRIFSALATSTKALTESADKFAALAERALWSLSGDPEVVGHAS